MASISFPFNIGIIWMGIFLCNQNQLYSPWHLY